MEQLRHVISHTSADLDEAGESLNGQNVTVAGLVTHVRSFPTKKGDMMAVLTIEDITGAINAVMFPRAWETFRDLVDEDAVIIARGKADTSRGELQIIVESVSQDFEMVTAVDALPDLDARNFSWLADDESDDSAEVGGDDREIDAAGPAYDDAPAETLTATPGIPPAESPRLSVEPPPTSGLVVDREMPGWLETELDNGWSPAPDVEYNDMGHIIRKKKGGEPPAFDESGRLMTPPAPAARARDQADSAPPPAETPSAPPRTRRPERAPEPEPEPGRLLTLTIERTGDSEKDRRRMRQLHGFLTQFPGNDHFRFVFRGGGKKAAAMEFPDTPIGINDEMLARAAQLLGGENVLVEEQS
jgi:DNA polymerase-3 subunit alpha